MRDDEIDLYLAKLDNYQHYPVLKGESLLYEHLTYTDLLSAFNKSKTFWENHDKAWYERVKKWAFAR